MQKVFYSSNQIVLPLLNISKNTYSTLNKQELNVLIAHFQATFHYVDCTKNEIFH